jgi:uncharacterized protein YaeQ
MAQRSTVYKAELQIADMDRGHYATHGLTIARHPSETEERLMVRLLAFALNADEALAFGRGLSTDDEPDLWLRDLTGAIRLWIEVGLPDEKWIRKACGRAERVLLVAYGGSKADAWWNQNASALARLDNLSVMRIDAETGAALAGLAQRSMLLSCNIQDGQAWIGSDSQGVTCEPAWLKAPSRS